MRALKKLLKKRHSIVFLDLEGTQFTHEVIALGAVKCQIDDNARIVKEDENGLIVYVKAQNPIGRIIKNLTHIDESFIADHGVNFDQALDILKEYVGEEFENTTFIVFGSNDARMLIESEKHSKPENAEICHTILGNIFDFLAFLSQFIRDENNNTYSLVNYLSVFNAKPIGESHNPLNDAIDLKNLYINFLNSPDIVKEEYEKILYNNKVFPQPVKEVLKKLQKGETVSKEDYEEFIKNYLA